VLLKASLGLTELWPTLALFHDHVRRFRILNIDVRTYDMVDTTFSAIAISRDIPNGNPAPLLDELRIAINRNTVDTEEQSYFEHAFYPSPRLHTLTVPSLKVPLSLSKFLSTVVALTIICQHNDDTSQFVGIALDTMETIPHLEFPNSSGTEHFQVQDISSLDYPHVVSLSHLEVADVTIPHLEFPNSSGTEHFQVQDISSLDYPHVVSLSHLEVADVTIPGPGLDILHCFQALTLRSVLLDG
jgi:hypothetical protein